MVGESQESSGASALVDDVLCFMKIDKINFLVENRGYKSGKDKRCSEVNTGSTSPNQAIAQDENKDFIFRENPSIFETLKFHASRRHTHTCRILTFYILIITS